MVPKGLLAIKEMLEAAKYRTLTLEDGRYVSREMESCCEATRWCGHRMECKDLDGKLATLLPPDAPKPVSTYRAKQDTGEWMQVTVSAIKEWPLIRC